MTRQALKHLLLQLAVIYTRYLVGGAFVFASLIKIKGHRFTQMDGSVAGHNPGCFFEMMYQSGRGLAWWWQRGHGGQPGGLRGACPSATGPGALVPFWPSSSARTGWARRKQKRPGNHCRAARFLRTAP